MAALVILSIVAIAFILALKSPRTCLMVALFLSVWSGLAVDLGLRLTAYQLFMAPLCLVMAVRLLYPGQEPRAIALGWPFFVMLLYAIITSAFQVAQVPQVEIANSWLRAPAVRATIQIMLYLFSLAPVVLVPWLFNETGDVRKLLRVWFASTLTLALIGFVQLIIWYGTGTNPIPLGAVSNLLGGSTALREGIVTVSDMFVYRMNSFANEPRNLGTALGLAMVVVQGLALGLPRLQAFRLFGIWLFLMAALLLTYSTSGIGVWLVGTLTLLPAMWLCRVQVQRSTRAIFAAASAVVIPMVVAVILANNAGIPVLEILTDRTIERLTPEAALQDFDLAIFKWLVSDPDKIWIGGGIGNTHLYATPYLLPEHARYAEGQVFSSKMFLLRWISEQGIVGLFLFVIFLFSRIFAASWVRISDRLTPILPISIALFAMTVASVQLTTELFFAAGTLVMLAGHRKTHRKGFVPPAVATSLQ